MEEEIIEKLLQQDRKTQNYLYSFYRRRFAGRIKKITDSHYIDIDSIINDSFLNIFENIHTFNKSGSLEAWMFSIVKFATLNAIKQNQRKYVIPSLPTESEIEIIDRQVRNYAEAQFLYIDIKNKVKGLYKLLPTHSYNSVARKYSWKIFRLYLMGYNCKEISEILSINMESCKKQLYHTKLELRKFLK